MTSSRISELAALVQSNTKRVDNYFQEQRLPQPSFEEHGPVDFAIQDAQVEASRIGAIEAALELHDLLIGPRMLIRPVLIATSLQYIYKFDIPAKVPLDGSISYVDLAKLIGEDEPTVRRIIRFAIVFHRIFHEKEPGMLSHSAASRYLRADDTAMAGLGVMFDEAYQSFAHTVEALGRPHEGKTAITGWSVAHNTELSRYEYVTQHPELGKRFGKAMSSFSTKPELSVMHLVDGYDWGSLDKGLVVDVGGANGYASFEIARKYPKLQLLVQDTAETIDLAKGNVPADVADRVELEAHDFLQPQTRKARVFLLRQILHNWSDEDCVRILKALIPGLEAGSRIVINDHLVIPPGSLPLSQERNIRDMDMIMLSFFNERDYEAGEWQAIFRQADSRFADIKISQPPGSLLAVIEAVWTG